MEKPQATRFAILAALAFALLMAGSYFMSPNQDGESFIATFPSGTQLTLEVADNERPLMLISGLAFRDSLASNSGMLFIYDRADFLLRNTQQYRFPVDIIWLDDAKRVLMMVEAATPCVSQNCPTYGPPPEKARYVIETQAGFVRRERLVVGNELRFALRM